MFPPRDPLGCLFPGIPFSYGLPQRHVRLGTADGIDGDIDKNCRDDLMLPAKIIGPKDREMNMRPESSRV